MRQSPSSSRNRSTTRFVASGGTAANEGIGRRRAGELGDEPADGRAELGGPPDAVALPEREPTGLAERGRDEHAVVRDLLNAPARRSEGEDVADARLVDHLLVELADAAPGARLADHEHAEQAAVGDGAAARDRESLRSPPTDDGAGVAIPDDAR